LPHALRLGFDQPVATTLTAGDIRLQRLSDGTVISPTAMAVVYDSALDLATITFPGQSGSLLPGGAYRLTLNAGSVADPAGNSLSPAFVHDFTVPFTDSDHDGLHDVWEFVHWGNINDHDADDDSDRDGMAALLELAFSRNPTRADAGGLPGTFVEGGYLTISIARQSGLSYLVETSGTIQPSTFSSAGTTVLIDNGTTLKVRDNVPVAAAERRLLRIRVTSP
jgi:hypothetical protein